MSRDFGAPGPRGVSGGTARFPLPPLPPGSAREESGGEFSRDHDPPPHTQHTACAPPSFCSPLSRERPARAAETPLEGGGPWVTWAGAAAILSLPPQRAVAQRVMAARREEGLLRPERTGLPPPPALRAGPDTPACGSVGLRPFLVLAAL
ncbi:splicing factor, proline- and glutamine-rich-like [Vidua macroura]|uniref:splicing factor, proline- and glutamine-rich-like n=1 Tax=Vidua macroura TaxID=187451 RepID=UPI0023A7FE53|nr:splicing factor, proline- and glutamine-rich-like [Vidua macroura]